jgi:DNA repair exonuclease SbcCD ATPase subunit
MQLPSIQNNGPLVPRKEELIPLKPQNISPTSSPVTAVGQKLLSREGLQRINSHKSFLSEMRTPRRKVMFLPEKENNKGKASASQRIDSLSISDLSLPCGCGNAKNSQPTKGLISSDVLDKIAHFSTSKGVEECGDKTEKNKRRKLRSKLRKSERMIKRLDVLMEKDELLVQKLRLENQELRRELICLPTIHQSQKLLTQEIEELEVQLKNLADELEVLREWETEERNCDHNSVFSDEHILGGTWNPFPQTSSPRRGKRESKSNKPTLSEALARL